MSIPENPNRSTEEQKGALELDEAQRKAAQRAREQTREVRSQMQQDAENISFFARLLDLFKWGKNRQFDVDLGEEHIENKYYYRITNLTAQPLYLDEYQQFGISAPVPGKSTNSRFYNGKFLRKFKDNLNKYRQENSILFEPLEIEPNESYRITNRTARRLGIENIDKKHDSNKWADLVIPPFGIRVVNSEILKWYKFVTWRDQDLIRLEPEKKAAKGPGILHAVWNWIKLLPGLVLVAAVGFGIPLWVVYHFGGGESLLDNFLVATGKLKADQIPLLLNGVAQGKLPDGVALNILGRIFQVGFICVAAVLPALFFYLFGRQHVEKLREKFFRDILVLDPHLYTLSEAESKYDTLLRSAYGSGGSNSPFAILLLMFSTAILVTGWTLTIAPYNPFPETRQTLVNFFEIKPSPFTLGFLGIYFFAINMVFRRYVRADLTPKTYANITVRMLITFVLVWSISSLPQFSSDMMKNGFLPLAFIIGVFPEDGFRVLRDSARQIIKRLNVHKEDGDAKDDDEKYPLTELEGLNKYDQARLLEEGIENIENLAHHDLVELLAYTHIPTPRLVDLFDQAILYLHLGLFDESKDGSKPPENDLTGREFLKYLRSYGVRTATDFMKLKNTLHADTYLREAITDKSLIARIHAIHETFGDDEWLAYISNWRIESSEAARIKVGLVNDPYDFYQLGEKKKLPDATTFAQMARSFRSENKEVAELLLQAGRAIDASKKNTESPDAKKDNASGSDQSESASSQRAGSSNQTDTMNEQAKTAMQDQNPQVATAAAG